MDHKDVPTLEEWENKFRSITSLEMQQEGAIITAATMEAQANFLAWANAFKTPTPTPRGREKSSSPQPL
jgi:hypothetical protein